MVRHRAIAIVGKAALARTAGHVGAVLPLAGFLAAGDFGRDLAA